MTRTIIELGTHFTMIERLKQLEHAAATDPNRFREFGGIDRAKALKEELAGYVGRLEKIVGG